MKHLAVFSDGKIQELLSGQLKYDLRFFKKKPEFLNKLSVGDIVYFRRRGEVLGQFEVGKIMVIENLEVGDWELVKYVNDIVIPAKAGIQEKESGSRIKSGMTQEDFEKLADENNTLIIIQITKLEQFITSPIEIDKRSKKEWVVLG